MKESAQRPILFRNVLALTITLVIGGLVYGAHLIEHLSGVTVLGAVEGKLIDQRYRLRGPVEPSGDVVVVGIDSKSVEKLGRWPWPRSTHARLIDRLREWGATAVTFDVLFTEEEGAKEAEHLRRVEAALPPGDASAEAHEAIERILDEVLADRMFAASLERTFDDDAALTVLAFDFVFEEDIAHTRRLGQVLSRSDEMTILDLAGYVTRDENVAYMRQDPPMLALGIRPVITQLADYCAGLGFANPIYDKDGSIRRERVLVIYSPVVRQAFQEKTDVTAALLDPKAPVQAFMPLAGAGVATHLRLTIDQFVLDMENGELRFPVPDGSGGTIERVYYFDPADGTSRIWFYGSTGAIPTHSLVDVLDDTLVNRHGTPISGPEAFEGKLVFVGMSDPGLADFFPTPFTARLPGVEKHATVAENMIHGQQVRAHPDYDLVVGLSALGAALVVALVAGNLGTLASATILFILAASWFGWTYRDFATDGLIWNWTVPGLTLVLGYAGVTALRQITEERAKRHVRGVFATYMSPAAVAEVLDDPDKLKLGGERRACSLFFSDLVGFTSLSESIDDPQDLVKLMNRYLGRMTELILEEDGILDKYIGDAIMAIFGAPIVRPDHAARACAAALRNMEALAVLRAEFEAEGLPSIDCRIGINTGEVVIGNMGSEMRMDYTALGDTVNLASRLEGANKQYGTHIMVGERTHAEAKEHDSSLVFRPLDLVAVKGKLEPVQVFELVGRESGLDDQRKRLIAAYAEALDAYRSHRFDEALAGFQAALEIDPEDGPSATYIERSQHFVAEPPPEPWDGVFRMTTK